MGEVKADYPTPLILTRFKDNCVMFGRKNNLLVKQEEKNIQSTPTAITPRGAATIGANPDSAKMIGSSANKQRTIQNVVDNSTSQQQVEEKAKQQQAQSLQKTDTTTADRLSRLTGLNDRVDEAVKSKISAASGQAVQGLQLSEEASRTMGTDLQQAVQAYYNKVNLGEDSSQEQLTMYRLLESYNIDPTEFQQSIDKTLSGSFSESAMLPTEFKVSDLIPVNGSLAETLGYDGDDAQLADDLGIDINTLSNMTLSEIQGRVRDIEQEEFSKVDAIRAEMANASPNRRAELQRQLQELGATGDTGLEASVDELVQEVDMADKVMFAGEELSLEDLLTDDKVNRTIEQALVLPSVMENLKRTEPDLARWIEDNKTLLESLTQDVRSQSSQFATTQEAYKDLIAGIDESIVRSIAGVGDEFVDVDEFGNIQNTLQDSGLYNAVKEDQSLNEAIKKTSDEDKNKLLTMSKEEIQEARDLAQKTKEDSVLRKLVDFKGEFALDEGAVEKIKSNLDILNRFRESPASTLVEEPGFVNYLKNGMLDEDVIDYLTSLDSSQEALQEFKEIGEMLQSKKQIDSIDTIDKATQYLLGTDTASANQVYQDLKKGAAWGDQYSIDTFNKLKGIFGNDGVDAKDLPRLLNHIKSKAGYGKGVKDFLQNTPDLGFSEDKTSFKPVPKDSPKMRLAAIMEGASNSNKDRVRGFFRDNNIDDNEAEQLMEMGYLGEMEIEKLIPRGTGAKIRAILDKRAAEKEAARKQFVRNTDARVTDWLKYNRYTEFLGNLIDISKIENLKQIGGYPVKNTKLGQGLNNYTIKFDRDTMTNYLTNEIRKQFGDVTEEEYIATVKPAMDRIMNSKVVQGILNKGMPAPKGIDSRLKENAKWETKNKGGGSSKSSGSQQYVR